MFRRVFMNVAHSDTPILSIWNVALLFPDKGIHVGAIATYITNMITKDLHFIVWLILKRHDEVHTVAFNIFGEMWNTHIWYILPVSLSISFTVILARRSDVVDGLAW